jgi:ABC-type lipoprotein release transport system permease subunit
MLVGEDRFDRGNLGSLVVGAPVRLLIAHQKPEEFAAISRSFALAGAFSSRHSTFDRQNVLVHIDSLRSMIGFPPESEPYVDVFSEASISLRDYGKAQETIDRLRLSQTLRRHGVFWTWEQRNQTFLEAVNHERALMKLVLFVIFVVAGFLIFATLSMMVAEKTRDIGILTAMGATRQGILAIFLLCGAAIGLTGCVLGLLAGYFSSIHLNDVNQWFLRQFEVELFPTAIYKLREVPYELDPLWMGQVAVIAMSLSLLFSFIPAWRAARFDPVEALRYE